MELYIAFYYFQFVFFVKRKCAKNAHKVLKKLTTVEQSLETYFKIWVVPFSTDDCGCREWFDLKSRSQFLGPCEHLGYHSIKLCETLLTF